MMKDEYELVTIYRGKDSSTYLADEFAELGENATPISIRQNPSENAPFHKIKLQDTDAIYFHQPKPTEEKQVNLGEDK
jgi:murein L,D-transpeptidase YcbB/YkuD